jgi:hypothetical protein
MDRIHGPDAGPDKTAVKSIKTTSTYIDVDGPPGMALAHSRRASLATRTA